ncbi:hypothetical protein ACFPMF_16580 [Larkinella bovis]|uniref:DUF5683 domain-containing protein n=1 Tax=Larkinella bovis TaxID=683041 RepID=A0ABW0IBY4_9BACT
MKSALILLTGLCLALVGLRVNEQIMTTAINPLIGDKSFVARFGSEPDETIDDKLRIHTHLEYVEQLLRQRTTPGLPKEQQKKRLFLLDKLKEYRQRGIFPKNYDYPNERKPCFIDKDGSICAVGYLVEQTAGREAAESINLRYQYATIYEMNDPDVVNWIAESGLTREECQMIQPAYSPPPPPAISNQYKITNAYAISSGLLNGANVALSGAQFMNRPGMTPKQLSTWGMLTGLATTTLGIINLEKFSYDYSVLTQSTYYGRELPSNQSKRTLSMVNIGAGAATTLLSLINRRAYKKTPRSVSFHVYTPPVDDGFALGLHVVKRL